MAEPREEPPICGDCTVFIADENALKPMGDTVNHCPMHAAAKDMLAALKAVVRDSGPSGHSFRCQAFNKNPFTVAKDCCGLRMAKEVAARGGAS